MLLADLDLILTDAFLIYGAHLLAGRVDPETIHAEWSANRREGDLAGILSDALESGRIEQSLRALLPKHSGYDKLKEMLGRYRQNAASAGWPWRSPVQEKRPSGRWVTWPPSPPQRAQRSFG